MCSQKPVSLLPRSRRRLVLQSVRRLGICVLLPLAVLATGVSAASAGGRPIPRSHPWVIRRILTVDQTFALCDAHPDAHFDISVLGFYVLPGHSLTVVEHTLRPIGGLTGGEHRVIVHGVVGCSYRNAAANLILSATSWRLARPRGRVPLG